MPEKHIYPKHIYEPIRIEIAVSYVQHEMRKLLRTTPQQYWKIIDKDISEWIRSPELSTPRDFWNGVHGVAMGFKLKIGFISLLTAQNIRWEKKKVNIKNLWFGVENKTTLEVRKGRLSAPEVIDFYSLPENKKKYEKHKKLGELLSVGTAPRDHHPIIAIQSVRDKKDIYSVYDGNRRLAKAIFDKKRSIETYLGTYKTKSKIPQNYWIPTSFLMDLVQQGEFIKNYKSTLRLLNDLIQMSESGKYELEKRVLVGDNGFRKKLKKDLFK